MIFKSGTRFWLKSSVRRGDMKFLSKRNVKCVIQLRICHLALMYNVFFMEFSNFSTRSCFPWTAMRDDSQSKRQCLIRSSWMNVAPRANIQRSVETLNLNQFSKLKCIKESIYFWVDCFNY